MIELNFSKKITLFLVICILSTSFNCQKSIEKINKKITKPKPKNYIDCALVRFMMPCTSSFDPVCGHLKDTNSCKKAPCVQTFTNGCLACTSGLISGYVPNSCKSKPIDSVLDDFQVASIDEIIEVEDPNLIGEGLGSTKDEIVMPVPPPPQLPDIPEVDYYTCTKDDRIKRRCNCSNNGFVCATLKWREYFPGDNTEYYKCKCEACQDRHVVKINDGLCPRDLNLAPAIYYCKPEDRSKMCTSEYTGVCAVTEGGLEEVGTACQGCLRSDVIAVYNTKCPTNDIFF